MSSDMSSVKFINLLHPDDIRDGSIQTGIRRHVMKDIGRSRRKRPRAEIVPLQLQPPLRGPESSNESWISILLDVPASLSPSGILGVDLDHRKLQIAHFINNEAKINYRACFTIWVRMGFSDPTAFYVSLATGTLFWGHLNGQSLMIDFKDNPESLKYYFEAIQQLSKRLNDPHECTSAGVIASILGCICHDTRINNWNRWAAHIDGLGQIYKLRGGFQGLENYIPYIAFWLDLVGSSAIDSRPRFPIPAELNAPTQNTSSFTDEFYHSLRSHSHYQLILSAFRMLSSVAQTVNANSEFLDFWQNEIGAIGLLGPVTHKLLSVPRMLHDLSDVAVIWETLRLTCLMVLSSLKSRFKMNVGDMAPLQQKFKDIIKVVSKVSDVQFHNLIVWSFTTAAIISPDLHSDAIPYLASYRLDTSEMINIARNIIWIDILYVRTRQL